MRLSFLPKFFHLEPHSHLPQLIFFCILYWKYSIVILSMHILPKISHTFKPNQAPNVASIVGYIISRMSRPYCKVLCSCTSTQNAKNIHMKCLLRVNFTLLALDKLQNSIPLGYVNKIMTEYIHSMCNLCCQNETSITNFPQLPLSWKWAFQA